MNIREFFLILTFISLSLSLISCERILQSNYDFLKNDTCSAVQANKPSDCFSASVNSDKCCSLKILNRFMCKSFNEKSEVKKTFDSYGGLDKMNVYLTTNILGSAEVQCIDNNPISEDIKTLANNCGSFNNPSL